jgi:DNA (cytosine-5)-methyltransferase 1
MKKAVPVYYNDNDPEVCEWLRELMNGGLIPEGDIDGRSIVEVEPGDLAPYAQCHFFAGIAGWPYGLQLAGVPELECWTGSCPCQSFSDAGNGLGMEDDRHLWPEWFRLIRERRPQLVFGEQVEEAIAYGWLDLVSSDMETEGYACGAIVLGAHSVGAPHIRQRLYWVADAHGLQHESDAGRARGEIACARGVGDASAGYAAGRGGETCALADSKYVGKRHDAGAVGAIEQQAETRQSQARSDAEHGGAACELGYSQHDGLHGIPELGGKKNEGGMLEFERPSHDTGRLGHADCARQLQGQERNQQIEGSRELEAGKPSEASGMADSDEQRGEPHGAGGSGEREGSEDTQGRYPVIPPSSGSAPRCVGWFWADAEWLWFKDKKYRPVEPGIFPLVAGLPRDVGRGRDPGAPLKVNATAEARETRIIGYGNAIVPQVAAEFIRAYMESIAFREREGNDDVYRRSTEIARKAISKTRERRR